MKITEGGRTGKGRGFEAVPAAAEEAKIARRVSGEPDAVRLRAVYEHFRRKEMTIWESEREIASELNRWRLHDMESEFTVLRKQVAQAASEGHEALGIVCPFWMKAVFQRK